MRTTLDEAIAVAAPIVADVRENGDAALADWTERLDGRVARSACPASGSARPGSTTTSRPRCVG